MKTEKNLKSMALSLLSLRLFFIPITRKSVMKLKLVLFVLLLMSVSVFAGNIEKPHVIVLTDISNEPDDEELMVRFLVYANEYDVEGLIATTSVWLQDKTREDLIRRQIDAYEKVRPNLMVHAKGFPEADALRQVTCTGQTGFGMEGNTPSPPLSD